MSRKRPKIAVGYMRVSSQEQADSGLSLEEQRREIEAIAERFGFQLAAVHSDEGVSGGLAAEDRDGIQILLSPFRRV